MLINRSILPSVPAPGQHSAHPSDLKEKPPSSLTASLLCGHSAAFQGPGGFPREANAKEMQEGEAEAPQELLWDLFSSLRTGIIAAGMQEQPKASSIPEAGSTSNSWSLPPAQIQLLGPQHVEEQLQGCSRDLCASFLTLCHHSRDCWTRHILLPTVRPLSQPNLSPSFSSCQE